MENIGTILGVAALIIPVWIVMWLIGRALAGANDRATKAETYSCKISAAQWARSSELQGLLWKIKATPEDKRAELWGRYLHLEVQHKSETYAERQTLVNMQTVIDDQTQYELDNGINSYVVEKPEKESKRARLGWQE